MGGPLEAVTSKGHSCDIKTYLTGLGEVAVVSLAHLIKLLLEIGEVLLAGFRLLLCAAEGEVKLLLPRLALRHLHPHHLSTSFQRDPPRWVQRREERGERREEREERREERGERREERRYLNLEITALLFTLVEMLLDLHLLVQVIALDGVDLFHRLL